MIDAELFVELTRIANEQFDGHFTGMKFTTNWRVCFGTLAAGRAHIRKMPEGQTFSEAANKAIKTLSCAYDY